MQISFPRFQPVQRQNVPVGARSTQEPSARSIEDVCEFGRLQVSEPLDLPIRSFARPQIGKGSNEELLQKMRPYIKDVFVVTAATGTAPPVLGGRGEENGVELPQSLKEIPSKRWVITPQIEASHQNLLEQRSNDELRSGNEEIKSFIAPILAERYQGKAGSVAVELGPATNTDIAKSLQSEDSLYFGMDVSRPFLERARELVNEPGHELENAYQVLGDTYRMPFQDDIADIVCVSCHPPFVSATPADKIRAFAEVKRVLKPNGEFALFPWDPTKVGQEVKEYLGKEFDLVESHSQYPGRELVFLRARD